MRFRDLALHLTRLRPALPSVGVVVVVVAAAAMVCGCQGKRASKSAVSVEQVPANFALSSAQNKPPPLPKRAAVTRSRRPRVRFKGGRRMARDLSDSLGLKVTDICKELGRYDCVSDIHRVSLAGVEPYKLAIWQPPKRISVTSPIAADRLVLAACARRSALDWKAPKKAKIFSDLTRLADSAAPSAAILRNLAQTLYRRILRRKATVVEEAALALLWRRIRAHTQAGKRPLQHYATLACYAVATTEEALFY